MTTKLALFKRRHTIHASPNQQLTSQQFQNINKMQMAFLYEMLIVLLTKLLTRILPI